MKSETLWRLASLAGLIVIAILLILLISSNNRYNNLKVELDAAETQITSRAGQLSQLQSDFSNLQTNYDAIDQQLADIQTIFPQREFSSAYELQSWLDANPVSTRPTTTYAAWYANALQLQADALNDGYIISVSFDYDPNEDAVFVYCETVIDGWIWFWDPETDDILQYTFFGPVN